MSERPLLESLKDYYRGRASLTYAAHRAGVSVSDAIDVMNKYGLPPANGENETSLERVDELLCEV